MAALRHPVSRIVLLTLVSALAAAAPDDDKPFDCRVTLGNVNYDLTSLAGEHTVSRSLQLPPSTIEDKVTFNLCEELKQKSDVPDDEQCPSGTRACLTRTSRKGDNDPQVISVILLANSSASAVTYKHLTSPKGIQLTYAGASYPSTIGADPTPQHFNLELLCDTETSEVEFNSYDGKDLWLSWKAPAGCELGVSPDEDTKKPDDSGGDGPGGDKEQAVGSGVGYFFLLLFLAFAAYFALGAYYNYSTYGATGADLIPHRDFWREVPYMLRDLVSHICSAVRPRQTATRGGYIAV
ncbi:autophagy-related protein 27 [Cerioporus squamosus]|nr:autophagy-related protein 27 [Cerioporus squamosus]